MSKPLYREERRVYGSKAWPPGPPHRLQNLRGPGFSNVILQSFCLAGAHPGNNTAEVISNLTPLLRAGITCFVSLQPELPKPGHSEPSSRAHFGSAVVARARDYLPDAQAMVDSGSFPQSGGPKLSLLHLPIPNANGCVAPDETVKSFVLSLVAHMKAGEFLYLQCGDGNGRTGTIAALLMGLAFNISSSEALDLCQRSRDDRPGAGGLSPETHEQKMQVHRLLGDAAFRKAAAEVEPRPANSIAADENARVTATLAKIRSVLARRGAYSLIYLKRYAQGHVLRSPLSETVTVAEFHRLCSDAEWFLTPDETETLWNAISGGAGEAPVESLWRTLRGRLNERRAAAVHDVFRRLSGGTGFVSLHRLASSFSPTAHPDVTNGKKTVDQITSDFLDTFGLNEKTEKGEKQVSAGDFEAYYASLSPSIHDDPLFELWVYGSWLPQGAMLHIPAQHSGITSTGSQGGSIDSATLLAATFGPGGSFKLDGGNSNRSNSFEGLDAQAAAISMSDDGRGNVSRVAALRNAHKQRLAEKVTSAPAPNAGPAIVGGSADGVTALALTQAYLQEMREERLGGDGERHGSTSLGIHGIGQEPIHIPLSTTEHGYSYVDLQDVGRIKIALRGLMRRTPTAGAFSMAALWGVLRRLDPLRTGLVSALELQTGLKEVGIPLPEADASLIFRTVGAHILRVRPHELDASKSSTSTKVPLEDLHACLRDPLEGPRLEAVRSIFQGFDRRGTGAVPVSTLLAAFNAEAFPPVAAGRIKANTVYKAFCDGFAEAFDACDKTGPEARRMASIAGDGPLNPAYRAYAAFGQGDGCVRFPFFKAFHEGLSALFRDQAEFVLAASHIWSGAGSRRQGAAQSFTATTHTLAAKADVKEEGFVANMERTGAGGASTPQKGGRTNFSRRGDFELGTALPRPPAHADQSSGASDASSLYGNEYGRGMTDSITGSGRKRLLRHSPGGHSEAGNVIFFGGDGLCGGVGTALRSNPHYSIGHGAAAELQATPWLPASIGDKEADACLASARNVLLRRGTRGIFRLSSDLHAAAQEQPGPEGGSLHQLAFADVLADLGLPDSGIKAIQRVVACSSHPSYASLPRFMHALRGELGPVRLEVVLQAYDHLRAQQAKTDPSGHASAHGELLLETVHFGYKSASHPDVLAGRRSEEEVLREFLETFTGQPYAHTTPAGVMVVPEAGFVTYYSNLSFGFAGDAHLCKIIYDTWSLSRMARRPAHEMETAAGKPTPNIAGLYSSAERPMTATQRTGGGGGGSAADGAGGGGGNIFRNLGDYASTDDERAAMLQAAQVERERMRNGGYLQQQQQAYSARAAAQEALQSEWAPAPKGSRMERLGYGYRA